MKSISITLLAAAAAVPAAACDLCAVYNVSAAQGAHDRGFFGGVAQQFTHFATLQENGDEIHDPANQRLDSSITQVIGGYNFHDRFGVQLNVPVIHRWFRRPEDGGIERGTETGLGDISLVLNAVPFRWEKMHSTFLWNIMGGIKLPTGNSHRLKEELEEGHHDESGEGEEDHEHGPESGVHGHDIALGSGSVDGVIGTGIFARQQRIFFSGSLQYAIRTEGDHHYRYGNDLMWNGGPGYFLLFEDEQTLSLQFVLSGEEKRYDELRGQKGDDTALTSVFAGPQLNYTWRDKLSAQAGIDLPLLLDNSAVQIVPDWRARAAVTWRF